MKKRRILLPILLLSTFILGGCNFGKKDSGNNDQTTYGVEIKNKAELEGEWYAGEGKSLSLTLTPEANALEALGAGELTVTSSDSAVVTVNGLGLKAMKQGEATITVAYHGAEASAKATILDGSCIAKYGAAHAGTLEDPLTNEDALLVAAHSKYAGEDLYVGGTISSFYNAPGSRTDGMVAYFLTPAAGQTAKFEVYGCFKEDGSKLTDDDIWVNGYAVAHGAFTKYNDQYETSSAKFVSCTGNKPAPRTTVVKTFAEALTAVKALEDGGDTYDYYQVDAYVTKKSGDNYFLTATQGEAITNEKENTIELYSVKDTDAAAKLTKNAAVTITMVLKNYHGQVENGLTVAADQINVTTPGTTWDVVPEPAVQNVTLAEFIASTAVDKTVKFHFSAEIKAFKSASTKDKYGNMTLTDGANDLTVYGSTATASALAWNDSDAYVFTNPQDFMTNDATKDLNVGDTVEVNFIRYVYSAKIQGQGIILSSSSGGGGGGGTPDAITSMEEIYTSGKAGDAIDVKGVYVGAYGNKTNEWYVANGDYALYLYQVNIPAGVSIGDSVRIQGNLGVYKGLIQVVSGATVEEVADVISYNTLSYTGGAFTKAQLSRPVQLTGQVKSAVAIDGNANKSVTVTVGTTDVTVYVKKSYGLDYAALNAAFGTAGATVTLKGYVAIYDNAGTVDYATSTGYQVVSPVVVA